MVGTAVGRESLGIEAAIETAQAGDAAAREVFARAGHASGLAMASMANLMGPERIIVTGDVPGLAAYELFEEQINRSFAAQAFGTDDHDPWYLAPHGGLSWSVRPGSCSSARRPPVTSSRPAPSPIRPPGCCCGTTR